MVCRLHEVFLGECEVNQELKLLWPVYAAVICTVETAYGCTQVVCGCMTENVRRWIIELAI